MYNKEQGQTLIEVLIALGIAIIVITSITTTVLTSLNNAQFTKYQDMASQYAQEGLEIVSPNIAESQQGDYCLDQGQTALSTPIVPDASGQCLNPNVGPNGTKIFKRTVTIGKTSNPCPSIAPGAGSLTRVAVTVSWSDAKCSALSYCHKAKEETCL